MPPILCHKIGRSFTILFFAFILMIAEAWAESEYETAAKNFLLFLKSSKQILSSRMIEANTVAPMESKVPIAYLVELSSGGYILVSTSRSLTPIKSYSLAGDFDSLPEAYKSYILNEMEYNVRAMSVGRIATQSMGETQQRWDFLLNYQPPSIAPLSYVPDTFLLSSRWNQDYPYDKFLPEIDGEKVVAGCVNIALAQVMKYHGHPDRGRGVVSYEWNGEELKAVLFRPYNWSIMPDVLSGSEPGYQIEEVAKLIRDLAILNETDLGLTGSNTSLNIPKVIHHLGFSNTIGRMKNTDEVLFFNTLQTEIDAERPVLLSFPTHMVVADGYASDPTGRKIHINMGWGGHHDDYYFLDQNVVAGGHVYAPDLAIYYPVKPCSGADCAADRESEDGIAGNMISGRFEYPHDIDEYDIYLKGQTTISGNRGYASQAFYISVYDSLSEMRASGDHTLSIDLPAGKYRVRATLFNPLGSIYYYFDQNLSYTVEVTTGSLAEAERATVDANLDLAPVFYDDYKDMLLCSATQSPYGLLVDVRDENGDFVSIDVENSNPGAVEAFLDGNVLYLTPAAGAGRTAATIRLSASANGKTTGKSFMVMVTDQELGYGKSFEVSGIFENQADFNTHRVLLDGACTISGYRGYGNQAFFSSVLDQNGNTILAPRDEEISDHFTQDIYLLGASLHNQGGVYYTYQQGTNDRYVLRISCPDADESTATIASLMNIDISAFGQATGIDPTGTFSEGKIYPADDVDIYRVELTQAGQLVVEAQGGEDLDINIELYNSNTEWIMGANENGGGGKERVYVSCPEPGYYFVQVTGANGSFSQNAYTLTSSFTPVADGYESNDQFLEAKLIDLNSPVEACLFPEGDQDYYKVTLPSMGRLSLSLTEASDPLNGVIYLYDGNQSQIGWADDLGEGGNEALSIHLDAGTYYIHIFDNDHGNYSLVPYRLSAGFLPLAEDDPYEVNDTINEATPLPTHVLLTGSKIYYPGDVDYFLIQMAQAGPAEIRVDNVPANLDLKIELYDDSGTFLAETDANSIGEGETLRVNLTQGSYYAKIFDIHNQFSDQTYTIMAPDVVPPALSLNPFINPTRFSEQTLRGSVEAGAVVEVTTGSPASSGYADVTGTTWTYSVTDLVEGPNDITITATDAAGNGAHVYVTITLDTVLPSFACNPVISLTNSSTLTVTGTVETGIRKVHGAHFLDGSTISDADAIIDGENWSYTITGLLEGSNGFMITAIDAAGNSVTVIFGVTLDTMAPSGSITMDDGASYTGATSVSLSLSATDANGISQMQFSNDDVTYSGPEAFATAKTWMLSAGDGTKTVYVKFKDNAGNWSQALSDTIVLDATPPEAPTLNGVTSPTRTTPQTISGTKEANSSIWLGGTEIVALDAATTWSHALALTEGTNSISLTAKDYVGNESGAVTSIIVFGIEPPLTLNAVTTPTRTTSQVISGTKWANSAIWLNGSQIVPIDDQTTWSYALVLTEGTNNISLTAKDAVGNESIVVTGSIVLDTTPPMVSIAPVVSPTNVNQQTVTGTVEAGAAVNIVTDTSASVDPATVTGSTWSCRITGLAEGNNLITVTATDAVGNASTITSTITLDQSAPMAIICGAPQGESCVAYATLKVEGTEVIAYRYKLDDQPYGAETDVTIPINLSDLSTGSHTIQVIGKNQIGNWQSEESSTSATWIVSAAQRGDIDGSGQVDLDDAILLLMIFAGHDNEIEVNPCGDVNGNGTLDQMDLVYILQTLAFVRD